MFHGTLTNYAQGLAQDKASALAEFIAPTVPVGAASGQFKRFDEKNAFQTYDTSRAIGGPRRRLEFAADDPFYNCQPQALEIAIDDHERALAGETDPLGLEEAKVQTLVSTAVNSHEAKVFSAVKAAKAADATAGVWSDAAKDPIAEIDELIEEIAVATGMLPNRMVFGIGAWRIFRNHAKVIARQPGAQIVGVNYSQAASMFLNPGMDLRVGLLSRDLTKFGKAKDAENIVGGEVFIFYGSNAPTPYDPSFAKTFVTKGGGADSVKMYRAESNVSDMLALDWSEDIQVVAPVTGRRITLS